MLSIKSYQRTILYTILHFAVDGICASIIFSRLYSDSYKECLIIFILYNFLAFLSQPVVGILMDRYFKPKLFLFVSVLMLSLGYAFSFQFILSSICLGIGNSFFHICGGTDVSRKSKNDIVSLGIFVSTGAIGLMLGQRCASESLLLAFFSILFILSIVFFFSKEEDRRINQDIELKQKMPKQMIGIFVCGILLVVSIRSFVGKIIYLDFEVSLGVYVGIACATCLGKALGGILAKYIGPSKTILISMIVAIACLCLGNTNPYTLCLGILLFNCSMPITLYYANVCLKGREGLAFGALAGALIPGYLLGMLEYSSLTGKILIALLSALSAIFICLISRGIKKYGAC